MKDEKTEPGVAMTAAEEAGTKALFSLPVPRFLT